MTDDGGATVADLPGDPATWPATVRDCLRFVRRESPAPTDLAEWWAREVDGASGDAAEEPGGRRLAFLEAAGLLDRSTTPVAPGRHGREYLDSHDETVLYEGLAAALPGLELVLAALAIRPLTDVEVADLLAAEREVASVDPETAQTHRRWLAALGFLEHDDGVNEITRRGRRVVDAAGGPEPPGGGVPTDETAADAPAGGVHGSGLRAGGAPAGGAGTSTDREAATGSDQSVRDGETDDETEHGPPDDADVRELKSLYDHTCALCGDRRRRADGEGFSRVHYLMPPGEPHDGPESPENAVVVCPNHRADLEHGVATIDPETLEIAHVHDPDVSGRRLATAGDHEPGAQYLAYHDAVIAELSD